MKNADYWRGRFEILEASAHRTAGESLQKLEEIYRGAEQSVAREIESWYQRFAQNNQLSLAEARRRLTSAQLEEFRWTVQQYVQAAQKADLSAEWLKKLENASARFHISRLEAIQLSIQQQAELLFGNQLDEVDGLLRQIVTDGRTRTAFEIQKGLGFGWDIAAPDPDKLDTLLKTPWTTDGRTFRDRCWTDKAALVDAVQRELVQGALRGDAPQKTVEAIRKQFGVARSKAARLVHTETSYFSALSQEKTYRELGVEQIEVVETLDGHTCPVCGALDGKVLPLSEYQPGVTVPPFHPNCVVPDTVIASPDGEAIMQSDYSGEIVEFATANGRRLGVTPNHIMLTSRGWVRAKNLIQGDQVIYYCGWNEFIVETNPTHNDRIPTIEQLFTSFLKFCAMPPISVPTTAEDLKGDAIENGKVDVVFINSFLRNKIDPSTAKFVSDLSLIRACELGESTFSGNCSLAQFLMGIGLASDGVMSGFDIANVLFSGSLAHHELVRLRRGTHYNTRLQQTACDNSFCNPKFSGNSFDAFAGGIKGDDFIQRKFFSGVGLSDGNSGLSQNTNNGLASTAKDIGDFCNTFPGVVELDNIIRIDRRFFSGHVYDISSLSTLYLCNGFLSSNCRGTTCPHYEDPEGERAARTAEGEVYYLPAGTTYSQWKKAFAEGGSKEGLTPARPRDYDSE